MRGKFKYNGKVYKWKFEISNDFIEINSWVDYEVKIKRWIFPIYTDHLILKSTNSREMNYYDFLKEYNNRTDNEIIKEIEQALIKEDVQVTKKLNRNREIEEMERRFR